MAEIYEKQNEFEKAAQLYLKSCLPVRAKEIIIKHSIKNDTLINQVLNELK